MIIRVSLSPLLWVSYCILQIHTDQTIMDEFLRGMRMDITSVWAK